MRKLLARVIGGPQSKDSSANDASGINIAGAAGRHSHHAILKRIVGGYGRYLGV